MTDNKETKVSKSKESVHYESLSSLKKKIEKDRSIATNIDSWDIVEEYEKGVKKFFIVDSTNGKKLFFLNPGTQREINQLKSEFENRKQFIKKELDGLKGEVRNGKESSLKELESLINRANSGEDVYPNIFNVIIYNFGPQELALLNKLNNKKKLVELSIIRVLNDNDFSYKFSSALQKKSSQETISSIFKKKLAELYPNKGVNLVNMLNNVIQDNELDKIITSSDGYNPELAIDIRSLDNFALLKSYNLQNSKDVAGLTYSEEIFNRWKSKKIEFKDISSILSLQKQREIFDDNIFNKDFTHSLLIKLNKFSKNGSVQLNKELVLNAFYEDLERFHPGAKEIYKDKLYTDQEQLVTKILEFQSTSAEVAAKFEAMGLKQSDIEKYGIRGTLLRKIEGSKAPDFVKGTLEGIVELAPAVLFLFSLWKGYKTFGWKGLVGLFLGDFLQSTVSGKSFFIQVLPNLWYGGQKMSEVTKMFSDLKNSAGGMFGSNENEERQLEDRADVTMANIVLGGLKGAEIAGVINTSSKTVDINKLALREEIKNNSAAMNLINNAGNESNKTALGKKLYRGLVRVYGGPTADIQTFDLAKALNGHADKTLETHIKTQIAEQEKQSAHKPQADSGTSAGAGVLAAVGGFFSPSEAHAATLPPNPSQNGTNPTVNPQQPLTDQSIPASIKTGQAHHSVTGPIEHNGGFLVPGARVDHTQVAVDVLGIQLSDTELAQLVNTLHIDFQNDKSENKETFKNKFIKEFEKLSDLSKQKLLSELLSKLEGTQKSILLQILKDYVEAQFQQTVKNLARDIDNKISQTEGDQKLYWEIQKLFLDSRGKSGINQIKEIQIKFSQIKEFDKLDIDLKNTLLSQIGIVNSMIASNIMDSSLSFLDAQFSSNGKKKFDEYKSMKSEELEKKLNGSIDYDVDVYVATNNVMAALKYYIGNRYQKDLLAGNIKITDNPIKHYYKVLEADIKNATIVNSEFQYTNVLGQEKSIKKISDFFYNPNAELKLFNEYQLGLEGVGGLKDSNAFLYSPDISEHTGIENKSGIIENSDEFFKTNSDKKQLSGFERLQFAKVEKLEKMGQYDEARLLIIQLLGDKVKSVDTNSVEYKNKFSEIHNDMDRKIRGQIRASLTDEQKKQITDIEAFENNAVSKTKASITQLRLQEQQVMNLSTDGLSEFEKQLISKGKKINSDSLFSPENVDFAISLGKLVGEIIVIELITMGIGGIAAGIAGAGVQVARGSRIFETAIGLGNKLNTTVKLSETSKLAGLTRRLAAGESIGYRLSGLGLHAGSFVGIQNAMHGNVPTNINEFGGYLFDTGLMMITLSGLQGVQRYMKGGYSIMGSKQISAALGNLASKGTIGSTSALGIEIASETTALYRLGQLEKQITLGVGLTTQDKLDAAYDGSTKELIQALAIVGGMRSWGRIIEGSGSRVVDNNGNSSVSTIRDGIQSEIVYIKSEINGQRIAKDFSESVYKSHIEKYPGTYNEILSSLKDARINGKDGLPGTLSKENVKKFGIYNKKYQEVYDKKTVDPERKNEIEKLDEQISKEIFERGESYKTELNQIESRLLILEGKFLEVERLRILIENFEQQVAQEPQNTSTTQPQDIQNTSTRQPQEPQNTSTTQPQEGKPSQGQPLTPGQEAKAFLENVGSASQQAFKNKMLEDCQNKGYVEYRNPAAIDLFIKQYPNWLKSVQPNGTTRFTPPDGTKITKNVEGNYEIEYPGEIRTTQESESQTLTTETAESTQLALPTNFNGFLTFFYEYKVSKLEVGKSLNLGDNIVIYNIDGKKYEVKVGGLMYEFKSSKEFTKKMNLALEANRDIVINEWNKESQKTLKDNLNKISVKGIDIKIKEVVENVEKEVVYKLSIRDEKLFISKIVDKKNGVTEEVVNTEEFLKNKSDILIDKILDNSAMILEKQGVLGKKLRDVLTPKDMEKLTASGIGKKFGSSILDWTYGRFINETKGSWKSVKDAKGATNTAFVAVRELFELSATGKSDPNKRDYLKSGAILALLAWDKAGTKEQYGAMDIAEFVLLNNVNLFVGLGIALRDGLDLTDKITGKKTVSISGQ